MPTKNTTRRHFLKAAGAAALTLPAAMDAMAAPRDKPNIVLLMADDFGYECLSCYGSTSYKTPVLDELARTGMRFQHCYSQPLCTPSRVQIMTGKYNHRNYIGFGVLKPDEKTFGHVMKSSGYATCVAGKWQLYGSSAQKGAQGKGMHPSKAGFDEHCLWQVEKKGSRYASPLIEKNGKTETLEGKYGPDVFCDFINGFIRRKKDQPFFIYYPMALTHDPFVPTPDSEDWKKNPDQRSTKYFGDMVAYTDKIVGQIVKQLEASGVRGRTLILFTGDNGTPREIRTKTRHGEIKGGKGRMTDAGTHVPLIANGLGIVKPGKINKDLVDFSDFLPTFAALGGASIPDKGSIDGRSFLPQLRGQPGTPREWVFCHYDCGKPQMPVGRFARDKRFKLYHDGRLYDLSTDINERKPVEAGKGSSEAEAARKKLQRVLDGMPEWKPPKGAVRKKKEKKRNRGKGRKNRRKGGKKQDDGGGGEKKEE